MKSKVPRRWCREAGAACVQRSRGTWLVATVAGPAGEKDGLMRDIRWDPLRLLSHPRQGAAGGWRALRSRLRRSLKPHAASPLPGGDNGVMVKRPSVERAPERGAGDCSRMESKRVNWAYPFRNGRMWPGWANPRRAPAPREHHGSRCCCCDRHSCWPHCCGPTRGDWSHHCSTSRRGSRRRFEQSTRWVVREPSQSVQTVWAGRFGYLQASWWWSHCRTLCREKVLVASMAVRKQPCARQQDRW